MSVYYFMTSDAGTVAAVFSTHSAVVGKEISRVVVKHGRLLLTRVRRHASGRPGPNAPTGDYRRAIALQVVRTPYATYAYIGTNEPQGRRLELGFDDVDALGREFHQPPYEHFGPAVDESENPFMLDLELIVPGAH